MQHQQNQGQWSLLRPLWSGTRYVQRAGWSYLRIAGVAGLLLCLLLVVNVLSLRLMAGNTLSVDVGTWGDQNLVHGVYEQETDATGATYRWSTEDSAFRLRGFAVVRQPLLTLAIGGLPQSTDHSREVAVALDNVGVVVPVAAIPRQYYLFAPADALNDGTFDVTMHGVATAVPPDPRPLAFRLDAITLNWSPDVWARPTVPMLLAQAALVLVWMAIGWRLEAPRWICALAGLSAVGLVGWSTSFDLLTAMAWQMRVLAHSLIILLLVWNAYTLLSRLVPVLGSRREVRWLLGITVLAILVRVCIIMYPPFGSHDLYIHRGRLIDIQHGQVYLFDRPSEFAGQVTTVPPAFYIAASPLSLLTADAGVAIQGLYALLEGSSALLVAIVARQLGAGPAAARLAAIVAASLAIQMTILWWGFAPQIVSQWLLLLLLVFLTHEGPVGAKFWLAASLSLVLAFLTHNGAVVLGGVAVASYAAFLYLQPRQSRGQWRYWLAVLAASSVLAVGLLYADIMLAQLRGVDVNQATTTVVSEETARIGRVWEGLQSSFRPLGYVLSSLSLLALIRCARGVQRRIVIAWLLSAALFLVIDLASGLQVRYAYFVTPMLCIGLGIVLSWLLQWRRWGTALVITGISIICWSGLSVLVQGVFLGVKPTLMALTH